VMNCLVGTETGRLLAMAAVRGVRDVTATNGRPDKLSALTPTVVNGLPTSTPIQTVGLPTSTEGLLTSA